MLRRLLRFRLRTLLVAMAIVAGVLVYNLQIVRERQRVRAEAEGMDWSFMTAEMVQQIIPQLPGQSPATIPIVRVWLDDEAVQYIWCPRGEMLSNRNVELKKLFTEAEFRERVPWCSFESN